MPILKDFREANYLEPFQKLPPTVQEKIRQIEVLYDRAILYLWARAEASKGVPDFESYLIDLYKNRVKSPKKDLDDILKDLLLKLRPEPAEYFIWNANHKSCIKILGDSRYYPWPGNWSHLVKMLYELWIYWLFWPSGRRFFEEKHEIRPWYRAEGEPDPPSAPSFEAALDLSLMWLAHELGREIENIWHQAKKKEGIAQRNLERKEKYRKREGGIVSAFHTVPKKKGDFLNSIVVLMFKSLNETVKKKTIDRWMKNNAPLMERYFQKEKRGKAIRWVYIGHTGV